MESCSKKRPLSTCSDDESVCQSRASSTFQRLAPSRLTARPSRWRRPKVSATASTYSTSSVEPDTPVSCVTRETAHDGCAFNRFMVWVAVKRNSIPGLTPDEKLECPLLQCRRRFPNHELMLQHVYTCEHLDTKAYYCYDCQREERFDDAKCKRCSGHPPRFRKLFSLSRYKALFSSMGRKARKEGGTGHLNLQPATPLEDPAASPPSYESLQLELNTPPQAELSSTTEIMELDSRPLATLPSSTAEVNNLGESSLETSSFSTCTSRTSATVAAELESVPKMASANAPAWAGQLGLLAPLGTAGPTMASPSRKPILQVNTALQRQASQASQTKPKSRSVGLAPSSSVRSNASGYSFMTSTVSSGMSPTSAWSGWNMPAGTDSSLTSPISPLCSPVGTQQSKQGLHFQEGPIDGGPMDTRDLLRGISPFPQDGSNLAFPYTAFDPQSCSYSNSFDNWGTDNLDLGSSGFSTSESFANNAIPSMLPHTPEPEEPDSLVQEAWAAVQQHVRVSGEKLKAIGHLQLASQFLELHPTTVASRGHATLKCLLQGEQQNDPLNLLCLEHLVFSWVALLDPDNARESSKRLVAQAFKYGACIPFRRRDEYNIILNTLWNMEPCIQAVMMPGTSPYPGEYDSSTSSTSSSNGKEKGAGFRTWSEDPILDAARFFLDKLEYLILGNPTQNQCSSRINGVKTADLRDEHQRKTNVDHTQGFRYATAQIARDLANNFGNSSDLGDRLSGANLLVAAAVVFTARDFELQLLNAGILGGLSLDTLLYDYCPYIRRQLQCLYANVAPRNKYYSLLLPAIDRRIHEVAMPMLRPVSEMGPANVDMMGQSSDNLLGFNAAVTSLSLQPQPAPDLASPSAGTDFSPIFGGLETYPQGDSTPILDIFEQNDIGDFDFESLFCSNVDSPPDQLVALDGPALQGATQPSNTKDFPTPMAAPSAASPSTQSSSDPGGPSSQLPDSRRLKRPRATPTGKEGSHGPKCHHAQCEYRPFGLPKWWKSSMDKHLRNTHCDKVVEWRCPYPGCKSMYRNRRDNLKAHQRERNHWWPPETKPSERHPRKKARTNN